jgi:DNA-binding CsgD family transcriptional regulator
MTYIRQIGEDGRCGTLTRREREVMLLIVDGFSDKEMSKKLGIDQGSAHWHVMNVFKKLGVHSREAARRVAVRGGVVACPGRRLKTYHFPTLRVVPNSCLIAASNMVREIPASEKALRSLCQK